MKVFLRVLPVFCVSSLLFGWFSACTPSLELRLAAGEQKLPTPTFQVLDPKHPEAPRYESISLYERTGGDASSDVLVWKVFSVEKGDRHGLQTFSYGETPRGFEQRQAPAILKPDTIYVLVVAGTGYATLAFQADSKGMVQRVSLH